MNQNYTPVKKLTFNSNQDQQNDHTAIKKKQIIYPSETKTQMPTRKIKLLDENNEKHYFAVYEDKKIGIPKVFQNIVHQSWNDDDKRTNTTQMQRGVIKTMQDFYDILEERKIQYASQNTVNSMSSYFKKE